LVILDITLVKEKVTALEALMGAAFQRDCAANLRHGYYAPSVRRIPHCER